MFREFLNVEVPPGNKGLISNHHFGYHGHLFSPPPRSRPLLSFAHGLIEEREVPVREIEEAIRRKRKFEANLE